MILSARVIGSPYILTLSGIGPSQYLMEFGINVRLDLPVGKNLRVIIIVPAPFSCPHFAPKSGMVITRTVIESLSTLASYFIFGNGWLSCSAYEAHAFVQSGLQDSNDSRPDIQILYFSAPLAPNDFLIEFSKGIKACKGGNHTF